MKTALLIIPIIVFFSSIISCVNYKAKLEVDVTDSADENLKDAYVLLLTEEDAREFEKGLTDNPAYYAIDSTQSNGKTSFFVKDDAPIYGLVAKQYYYYQEFFIESPLSDKSKNKMVVKLGKIYDLTQLSGKANSLWLKR